MVSSARFTRQADVALRPVLAKGDQLVAVARVVSGPPPYTVAVLGALATIIAWVIAAVVAPATQLSTLWLAVLLATTAFAGPYFVTAWIQPPAYIGVSRQQLICARLTAFRQVPAEIVATPLSAVVIHNYRHGRRTTSITLEVPGTRPLRLHAIRRRQRDLEQVLTWVRMAGVPIAEKSSRWPDN
jgi:hypothetical protein